MISAQDAVAICRLLDEQQIHFYVMGGWGVDALLGRETRPHKDLDLLVLAADLPLLWQMFDAHGFTQQWTWEENRWLERGGIRLPTAFVVGDATGRELDVHVIDLGPDGAVVQLYHPPWAFPDEIAAVGAIAGAAIPCVSTATQLAMHSGYPLPEAHRLDVDLLRAER